MLERFRWVKKIRSRRRLGGVQSLRPRLHVSLGGEGGGLFSNSRLFTNKFDLKKSVYFFPFWEFHSQQDYSAHREKRDGAVALLDVSRGLLTGGSRLGDRVEAGFRYQRPRSRRKAFQWRCPHWCDVIWALSGLSENIFIIVMVMG